MSSYEDSRVSVKAFSNLAKCPVPGWMPKDLGNWKYTVIYTMVSELARGTKHKMHGDFELLAATWPSMAIKWKPTKNSLVKKGDVLEVKGDMQHFA